MRQFYDPNIDPLASTHTMSAEESKHILRVLRMDIGDELELINGKGGTFHGEIIATESKLCTIKILDRAQEEPEINQIHIAVAPTKQNERIEWFIEKATEIGITQITLIQCSNSERIRLKTDRLVKKAVSAMKQSKRKYLPAIHELTDVKDFIKSHPNGLIAHCYEGDPNDFENVFRPDNCPILIGPEGDFSHDEIELALQNGYKTVTLGKNRLRTETAALYACMRAKLITG